MGAHTLSHYTFFNGSDMVLYLCKISACYVKWKCKSKGGGGKNGIDLGTTFFQRFKYVFGGGLCTQKTLEMYYFGMVPFVRTYLMSQIMSQNHHILYSDAI